MIKNRHVQAQLDALGKPAPESGDPLDSPMRTDLAREEVGRRAGPGKPRLVAEQLLDHEDPCSILVHCEDRDETDGLPPGSSAEEYYMTNISTKKETR